MAFVKFITDEHLLRCIEALHLGYLQCQRQMTMEKFYKNKVDPIKFYFDTFFNEVDLESYIDLEIVRQNDKTISNHIGMFHQKLIGGINGYEEMGTGGGCDIRSSDNTLFVEIKNKHNTMNSSSAEATFQKLQRFAENYPSATCYLMEVIAKQSQDVLWEAKLNKTDYAHPRVRKISADKFYALITGMETAFYDLCKAIPDATSYYLSISDRANKTKTGNHSLYAEINSRAMNNKVDPLSQIMLDNFYGYLGF